MRAFFLFLGLVLGGWGSYSQDWPIRLLALLLACLLLGISIARKEVTPFLVGLFVGTMAGLVHIPFSERKQTFTGMVILSKQNYVILWRPFQRIYLSIKDGDFQWGDWVRVSGSVQPFKMTTYECRFDFKQYLYRLGVTQEIHANFVERKMGLPLRVNEFRDRFLSAFSNQNQALLDCLLFGRNDSSSYGVSLLTSLNLLYVCSCSGIFFSFFFRLVKKWMMRLLNDEKKGMIAALVVSIFFIPISIRKIGIARGIISNLYTFINTYYCKKKYNGICRTSLTGITLFLLNKYSVFQSGFLIGFGLSYLLQFTSIQWMGHSPLEKKFFGFLMLRYFLLPLSFGGGSLHLFGGLISLLAMPYLFVLCLLGYVSYLTFPFKAILNPLCKGFLSYLGCLQRIDLMFEFPKWSWAFEVVFYVLLVGGLILREYGFRRWNAWGTTLFWASYAISLIPIVPCLEQSVTFINVGQGDSILLVNRNENVLIDTGGSLSFDMAKETLIPYFKSRRIYHIDYLIASHHDFDHIGAGESLRQHFDVRHYIDEAKDFPLRLNMWGFQNYNIYGGTEENDTSLVLGLDFMGKKWLFTGDAPVNIEKRIVRDHPELRADVLKVGHHGSSTSTCEAWLSTIKCKEAIISCGEKNSYGHPNKEVLERLQNYGVKIRRTDQEGSIRYARYSFPPL